MSFKIEGAIPVFVENKDDVKSNAKQRLGKGFPTGIDIHILEIRKADEKEE